MVRVDRSRIAEEDLLAIAEYIANDNPRAASRWLDEMEKKILLLANQPYMGESVEHIRPGLHRVTHGNYLIFYEPLANGIALIRVLHGARKIEDLF